MLETELWELWLVLLQMRGWPKISVIYMNRLENCSLRLSFWALITGNVACRCRVESRWMRVNASFIPQLSAAATLCLSCCLSAPAVEVSVVHPLLSFGISLPPPFCLFRFSDVSPTLFLHITYHSKIQTSAETCKHDWRTNLNKYSFYGRFRARFLNSSCLKLRRQDIWENWKSVQQSHVNEMLVVVRWQSMGRIWSERWFNPLWRSLHMDLPGACSRQTLPFYL